MKPLVVICLAAVTSSFWVPFGIYGKELFTRTQYKRNFATNLTGFHYLFVDSNGVASYDRGPPGSKIEIAGSPNSSEKALWVAADIVAKMTKYMPTVIFYNLALESGVGVFTAAEKLTVFPEYASYANGNCSKWCNGTCSHTCGYGGRKVEDLAGLGSRRAVILDDNLLCTARDPYLHSENILSHEFTHTIHQYALPVSVKHQITAAYNAAKLNSTWTLHSYAMTDEREYFAEAGSIFFFINTNSDETGGMTSCGKTVCATEHDAREHLRNKDPNIFNVLTYVFTNNQSDISLGLSVCPHGTVVG